MGDALVFVGGVLIGAAMSLIVFAPPSESAMRRRGYRPCHMCRLGDAGTPGWVRDLTDTGAGRPGDES